MNILKRFKNAEDGLIYFQWEKKWSIKYKLLKYQKVKAWNELKNLIRELLKWHKKYRTNYVLKNERKING